MNNPSYTDPELITSREHHFEYYLSPHGGWYWRLVASRTSKVIADGSEPYANEANVKRAINNIVNRLSGEKAIPILPAKPKLPKATKAPKATKK